MANGEFPGPSEEKAERKNQEGLTEEEKEKIREDRGFMKIINKVSEEYNGNADVAFQVVDKEAGEVIFNLHVQINKENIIEMKPMLPEELPAQDIKVQLDFDKLYELINFEEENMRGAELESPPWDRQPRHGTKKGLTDGINMYFKVRSLINSIEVTPKDAKGDAKNIMMSFMKMMGDKEDNREDFKEDKDENKEFSEETQAPNPST